MSRPDGDTYCGEHRRRMVMRMGLRRLALSALLLSACAPGPPSPDAAADGGVDGSTSPAGSATDGGVDASEAPADSATDGGVDGFASPDLGSPDDLSIPSCAPNCADGKACVVAADCAGRECDHCLCATNLCLDGKKDGKETDIDCGGGTCLKCGGKKSCSGGGDCLSGQCNAGRCVGALGLSFARSDLTDPKGCGVDSERVAIGDFNGDLFPDLVTGWGSCPGPPGSGDQGGVTFWLSDGKGGFAPSAKYFVWNQNSHTFGAVCFVGPVGDFNGDGKLDATVFCSYGTANLNSDYSLCLGDGLGGFASCNPAMGIPGADAAADWNGDGRLDLDLGGRVFLGDGKGGFSIPPPNELSYSTVFTGDLNGDQRLDSVVAAAPLNEGYQGIAVLLGKGDGTFNDWANFVLPDPTGVLALADVNSDGMLDLVLFDSHGVSSRLGLGKGAFGPAIASPKVMPDPQWETMVGAAADFDQDGALDVACLSNTGLSVLLGGGDGTFKPVTIPLNGLSAQGLAVADFNRDGKPDIAVDSYQAKGPTMFVNTSH